MKLIPLAVEIGGTRGVYGICTVHVTQERKEGQRWIVFVNGGAGKK